MANTINTGRQYTLVLEQPFDFQDLATANLVGGKAKFKPRLPQGAVPLRGSVLVTTAFNGSTPTLAVAGETSSVTYVAAASLAAVGNVALSFTPAVRTSGDVVALTPNAGGAASTAGAGILYIEYVITGRGMEAQP